MKFTSIHIKNILVPHAGTLGGDKALSNAIYIAKLSGATIKILHVIQPLETPSKLLFLSGERTSLQSKLKKTYSFIEKNMEDEIKDRVQICKSKNINANYKITRGIPEDEIIKFSKRHKIDLIIMSKRRKIPGVKGLLKLGSVSRKILEVGKYPVLLVDT